MAVELITGYSGEEHVSSADDGARQAGTVGTGMYAMATGQQLSATLENANTVTVASGDVVMNGRHVRLTGGTTFAVPVGTQGMSTSNLLVLRYSVASDGKESVEPMTLTGEPAASDPVDPALSTGSILDGDSPVDMPLYRVVTTGIDTAEPERLFSTVEPLSETKSLSPMTSIPSAADLDDYTEAGSYSCSAEASATVTNKPAAVEGAFLLYVYEGPGGGSDS